MTTAPPAPAAAGPLTVRLDRPRAVLAAAALMIVVQLGFRAWAVLGSWYRYDDANFIARLLGDGLSGWLMLHGYAGHLMPGAFALTAFNLSQDPYAWGWPATELLVLQGVADLGALVFLVSGFGRRPGILAPLALFLFSPISLPAALTWGPGITQLPFLAAIFWGGWTNLRYLRSRRVGWALATMAITLVAVGFGEKALLLFWTYAVVALCWFASGDLLARVRSVVRRYLPGVALYTVVAGAAVAAYLVVGVGTNGTGGRVAGAQTYAEVAERLVLDSWAPAVLGGPLRWRWPSTASTGLADPGTVVTVVAVLLLAALTWEVARTRTRAVRAWWLVGGILAADIVMVTLARAVAVGPDLALAFRYLTETAAVGAIALAAATMPLLGALEPVTTRASSPLLDSPRRATVATAVVVALGLFSSLSYAQEWHAQDRTHRYVSHLRADLASVPDPVPVADGPVPEWMVWGAAAPDNRVSRALRPLTSRMRFPQVSTDNLYVVDDHGHVRPVAVRAERHAVAAAAGTPCAARVRAGSARVALDGPVVGAGWWVRVSYGAAGAGTMRVTAGDAVYDVDVEPGFRSLFLRTRGGRFESVSFSQVSKGSMTCVSGVEVGHPTPFGAPISSRSGS